MKIMVLQIPQALISMCHEYRASGMGVIPVDDVLRCAIDRSLALRNGGPEPELRDYGMLDDIYLTYHDVINGILTKYVPRLLEELEIATIRNPYLVDVSADTFAVSDNKEHT